MTDEKTGDLGRADNWKERFCHLNRSMHNYLRITRILKCLGEMQLEHLKAPFVRYVLHEIITEQTLYNCLDSCINYWLQVYCVTIAKIIMGQNSSVKSSQYFIPLDYTVYLYVVAGM